MGWPASVAEQTCDEEFFVAAAAVTVAAAVEVADVHLLQVVAALILLLKNCSNLTMALQLMGQLPLTQPLSMLSLL